MARNKDRYPATDLPDTRGDVVPEKETAGVVGQPVPGTAPVIDRDTSFFAKRNPDVRVPRSTIDRRTGLNDRRQNNRRTTK